MVAMVLLGFLGKRGKRGGLVVRRGRGGSRCGGRAFLAGVVLGEEAFDGLEDEGELFVVFFSRRLIWRARSRLLSMRRRSWTKVRMMAMLTSAARGERSTLESMATPCSVKAMGGWRSPWRSDLEITFCDLQFSSSSLLRTNMKSSGKRSLFRRDGLLEGAGFDAVEAGEIPVEDDLFPPGSSGSWGRGSRS